MTEEQKLRAEALGISPEILALDTTEMKAKAVDWHAKALRFENSTVTGGQWKANMELAEEWRAKALFLDELTGAEEQREANAGNAKWGMF